MDLKCFLISALIFSRLSNSPILMSFAQINTPCSPTMLSSVTGCMHFLTGGASSPTSDCCGALKSLTGTGMDCLCLIVTANVPLDLPINRTQAISLPRACGIPVQCEGTYPLFLFFEILIYYFFCFWCFISILLNFDLFFFLNVNICEIAQLLHHFFILQVNCTDNFTEFV